MRDGEFVRRPTRAAPINLKPAVVVRRFRVVAHPALLREILNAKRRSKVRAPRKDALRVKRFTRGLREPRRAIAAFGITTRCSYRRSQIYRFARFAREHSRA